MKMQKLNLIKIVLALLIAGCKQNPAATAITGNPIKPNESTLASPVTLEATITKNHAATGEPIIVHLALKFTGHVIYLARNDYFHCYYAMVRAPSGLGLPFSDDGAVFFNSHTAGSVQVAKVLGPHHDDYDFDLSELYDFSQEGTYTVTFWRALSRNPFAKFAPDPNFPAPDVSGTVYSNPVTFSVRKL